MKIRKVKQRFWRRQSGKLGPAGQAQSAAPASPMGLRISWVAGALLGPLAAAPNFAVAQSVPASVVGLPHPCSACGSQKAGWDRLGTGSTTTLSNSNHLLTINQNASSAIFNWQDFNINAGNTVKFVQPSSSAVALNRIFDPNQTSINGTLTANGQIYLINPNGILFGKNAYVDVGGLIATTLNVSDTRITQGLLSDTLVSDPVFAAVTAPNSTTDLTATPGSPTAGRIQILPGATLHAGAVDQSGTVVTTGRVFLFAPTVENGGTITVDGGGQAILAAGSNVYLGSSADPSLRGLLVEVNGGAGGVTVDASGTITVNHGNATLMGLAVNQNGAVVATSALRENGSITLIAREATPSGSISQHDPNATIQGSTLFTLDNPNAASFVPGHVVVGSGSVTAVTLDAADSATAPFTDTTASSLRSTITIQGGKVDIGGPGNPGQGTLIQAHGGDVTIEARQDTSTGYGIGSLATLGHAQPGADVNIGADVRIDVSGLQNVAVDGARNFVFIDRLTSSNLSASPLQREGFLLGKGVYLNIAAAPSFIDVSNLQSSLSGTQAERNTAGGTIALRAEGAVNAAAGSVLDVSGGSTAVSAAIGRTSRLIDQNGKVVDITNASADDVYVGFADVLTHHYVSPRDGIDSTTTTQAPAYTQVGGYTQGQAAGTIQVFSPAASLNGTMLAKTITGTNQRLSPPAGGTIIVGSAGPNAGDPESQAYLSRPNVVVATDSSGLTTTVDPSGNSATLLLDAAVLVANGFKQYDLTSDGAIVIAGHKPLDLGVGASFVARANAIVAGAGISTSGGTISLSERPLSASTRDNPNDPTQAAINARNQLSILPSNYVRGSITLGAGTLFSTAGNWTNDALQPDAIPTSSVALNGGQIALSGRVVDVSGARFDVSAGANLARGNVFTSGNAGSLSITATDRSEAPVPGAQDFGQLTLGSDFASRISGFGVSQGGILTLTAPSMQLGGASNSASTIVIDPQVGQRGFSTFSFLGYTDLTVATGTTFAPTSPRLFNNYALDQTPSNASLLAVTAPQLVPAPLPLPSSNITLAAASPLAGALTVQPGAVVSAGNQGSITLQGASSTVIDGALLAPAGTIKVSTAALPAPPGQITGFTVIPDQRVLSLGSDARIDVSGVSEVTQNAAGVRSGSVLDAGSVTLNAVDSTLSVSPGAQIQAHGASDTVDLVQANGSLQPTRVASAGGTVVLESSPINGNSGVLIAGSFNASGGGAGAIGGNLSVDVSGSGLAIDPTPLPLPAAGQPLSVANFGGVSHVAPSLINSSGFDRVWLASDNAISVSQPVQLVTRESLVLDTPMISATAAGANLSLSAPYVSIGSGPFTLQSNTPHPPSGNATPGSATLQVSTQQLDLTGTFSLQGFDQATLRSSGDIRLIGSTTAAQTPSGSLSFAGTLELDAAQIYPATETAYTISGTPSASGAATGTIVVGSSTGAARPALSAGGSLNLAAADIVINGTVSAPQGSVAVDAVNSFTLGSTGELSVSGSGVVPFGTVLNGNTWYYTAITGNGVPPNVVGSTTTGTNLPSKGISIAAPTVDLRPGSKVNVAAGGDVLATEFIPGPFGQVDYSQNTITVNGKTQANPYFALIPGQTNGFGPYDPQIDSGLTDNPAISTTSQFAFSTGQTITLAGGRGIPAGTYTIMPAQYAFLPGAYAVKAVYGTQDFIPGASIREADGSVIVAGKFGYSADGAAQSRWSGFRVYTSTQFQTFAQYVDHYGSTFFPAAAADVNQAAPRTGVDAGSLSISAQALALNGEIDAASPNGRGVDLSISAPSIIVADNAVPNAPQSQLVLGADKLSALGAETIVLGANDSFSGTTMSLANLAQSVSVTTSRPLQAGEVVLAAAGSVDVGSGATVAAAGGSVPSTAAISISGDAAALIVTKSAILPTVTHTSGSGLSGDLSIAGNAVIQGASVEFDASRTQTYSSAMQLNSTNVALSASTMTFGAAPAGTTGLDLTDALLTQFGAVGNLTLSSSGGFSVYGDATVGSRDSTGTPLLSSLTLNGPGISGFGAAGSTLTINAGHVALDATGQTIPPVAGTGAGSLVIDAIATSAKGADGGVSVAGNVSLSGFGAVAVNALGATATSGPTAAGGDLRFSGGVASSASLNLAGTATTLSIAAGRIVADHGVNASIVVPGSLTVANVGSAPAAETKELGASLAVQAGSVDFGGRIDLPAGNVSISATNDLVLEPGSSIRVAGVSQAFGPATQDASAGAITLASAAGSVNLSSGSTLDLSGAGAQGDAGSLSLSAPVGSVQLAGTLLLTPGTSARGADISLDANTLPSLTSIAQAINTGSGGFAADSISVRARGGDLTLGAGDTLRAHNITLEADGGGVATAGSIDIAGQLLASGVSGGQVSVYANDKVTLESGGLIDARSTGAGQSGGSVMISSRVTANAGAPTTLDAITIVQGAKIDVSAAGATDPSLGGTITLRANANSATNPTDVEIAALPAGSLVGARQTIVEGVIVDPVASGTDVGAEVAAQAGLLSGYMSATNRASMTQRLFGTTTPDSSFSLRPGLEIQSSGDLTVSTPIDFAVGLGSSDASTCTTCTYRYSGGTVVNAQGVAVSDPGALTLRAAGNLTLSAGISDGFVSAGSATVWTGGESWSYRLAAGADLSAADPLRTSAAADLVIGTGAAGSNTVVRTGTGSISLAAGRDVVLNNGIGQQGNVVYTAGVANATTPTFLTISGITPTIVRDGGDLSIIAGRNILGTDSAGLNQIGSTQFIGEWLYRGGAGTLAFPTAWWVNFGTFQQGFGALGGGNLSMLAGGDITRAGAVVAANGYAVGGQVSEFNAGALDVKAGGKIVQGLYYDEAGAAGLRADAIVGNSSAQSQVPVADFSLQNVRLAMGSNRLDVQARTELDVSAPINPTAFAHSLALVGGGRGGSNKYSTDFFTYADASFFDARVSAGNIQLQGLALDSLNVRPGIDYVGDVMPPTVSLASFGGNVAGSFTGTSTNGDNTPAEHSIRSFFRLFPSATGNLTILAAQNVIDAAFVMSQADPSLVPSAVNPATGVFASHPTAPSLLDKPILGAPLHANDSQPVEVIARGGNIDTGFLLLPKFADIAATGKIYSSTGAPVVLDIQNANPDSLTRVSAGTTLDLSAASFSHIYIDGPGAAEVVSGGPMNLGIELGNEIISRGNLINPNLSPQGASLLVAVGSGQDAQGFANRPDYANVIVQFLTNNAFAADGSLSSALNAEVVAALPTTATYKPLVDLLNNALSARAAGTPLSTGQLLAQIDALAPATLAVGAVRLTAAIQDVSSARFVATANTDTFAAGYASFSDLFPGTQDSAAMIRSFVGANPFAAEPGAASSLRDQALAGLPPALVSAIRTGLASGGVGQAGSAFEAALAQLDPGVLQQGARQLLANVLNVSGGETNRLRANGQLLASQGSPFAKELTSLASSMSGSGAVGANDLSMVYSQITADQSGDVAVLAPRGGVQVGESAPPAGAPPKPASSLGILTLGGGDIIGMVRDNFDVFQSRVFTVAGGDISLWSSLANIDAGRGPRDVQVAPAPVIVVDPATGVETYSIGGAVSGSGIGALKTEPNQPVSNINLIAPAGYVDAGEAGIRASTGSVILGTNLVLNASNIQSAGGVTGGAVVAAAPPPLPSSTSTDTSQRLVEAMQRDALSSEQQEEKRRERERRMRVTGEFIGFGPDEEKGKGK